MGQHHFDDLTRTLSSLPTRRDVLRGLPGCGLGLGALRWPGPAEAIWEEGRGCTSPSATERKSSNDRDWSGRVS